MATNAASAVACDLKDISLADGGRRQTGEYVDEFSLRDGRKIYVLGEGSNVNLTSAEGHPASVIDLSLANQALSIEFVVNCHATLANKVYAVLQELDWHVARLKLEAMGVKIDRLNVEQEKYLSICIEGTQLTDRRVSLGVN